MSWTNGPLRLYHGTDLNSLHQILAHGVDLSCCSPKTDFGSGFYATTMRTQAISWARLRCTLRGHGFRPAILKFAIDRRVLADGSHLFFTHEDDRRTQYWQFVDYCRDGNAPHVPGGANYAMVSGPVSLPRQRFVMKDCDQVSFHDATGGKALDPRVAAAIASGEIVDVGIADDDRDPVKGGGSVVGNVALAGMGMRASGQAMRQFFGSVQAALEAAAHPRIDDAMKRLRQAARWPMLLHLDPSHAASLLGAWSRSSAESPTSVAATAGANAPPRSPRRPDVTGAL